MVLLDILEVMHKWLNNVNKRYDAWLNTEILEDTEIMFRVILESKNQLAELIVNEPEFAPYQFVSFQVLGIDNDGDPASEYCFYDDESCDILFILQKVDWLLEKLIVREQFLHAAEEFGFEIIMPFCLDKGKEIYAFGYMPGYGSVKVAVIGLLNEDNTNENIKCWYRENNGYFLSFLNVEPLLGPYKRSYFRNLLRDWRI